MRLIAILLTLAMPAILQAHPGHGASNGHDALHFLLSPGHAGPALVMIFAASLYLLLRTPKTKGRPVKH